MTDIQKRCLSVPIVIVAVWGLVTAYAVIHDQYIVRIAPEHFTVYHHGIDVALHPYLLAACYAVVAALIPGLALGCALAVASQVGRMPRVSVKTVLLSVCAVIALAELLAASAGGIAYISKAPLYPIGWYRNLRLDLVIAQTIQFTCYLVATAGSVATIIWLPLYRSQKHRANRQGNSIARHKQ